MVGISLIKYIITTILGGSFLTTLYISSKIKKAKKKSQENLNISDDLFSIVEKQPRCFSSVENNFYIFFMLNSFIYYASIFVLNKLIIFIRIFPSLTYRIIYIFVAFVYIACIYKYINLYMLVLILLINLRMIYYIINTKK